MITGKARYGCKVWASIGGRQIDEIRAGKPITANMDTGDYIRLVSPVAGWTKKSMVDLDPPAPPTTPPSDTPDYIVAFWADGRTQKYVPE